MVVVLMARFINEGHARRATGLYLSSVSELGDSYCSMACWSCHHHQTSIITNILVLYCDHDCSYSNRHGHTTRANHLITLIFQCTDARLCGTQHSLTAFVSLISSLQQARPQLDYVRSLIYQEAQAESRCGM